MVNGSFVRVERLVRLVRLARLVSLVRLLRLVLKRVNTAGHYVMASGT